MGRVWGVWDESGGVEDESGGRGRVLGVGDESRE